MSDLVWIVYFVDTVFRSVSILNGTLSFCAFLSLVAYLVYRIHCDIYNLTPKVKVTDLPIKKVIFTIFTLSLLPSKDTAYKMMAVYAGTEVMQSEQATEIGNKSLKVINKVMDEYLAEDKD